MKKKIKNEDLAKLYRNQCLPTVMPNGDLCFDGVDNECDIMNAVALTNIDVSLRRIAASLENGEKVKQLDAALGKAEGEIKRLSLELAETKNDLGKVEGRAAHFEAQSNALYARNNLAEVKVMDLRMELAKKFSGNLFFEATDPVLDALKGRITK